MSRHTTRWTIFGLAALIALAAFLAVQLPYLPIVHGSEADEVDDLVAWLGVEPGMHVADLGAGDGRFALALAERVGPTGHVYATELSAARLDHMRDAAAEAGHDNFSVIEAGVTRTNLPDGCCDALFSRNVYHHLTEPDAINADIHRALRSRGRLLIIDFPPGGALDAVRPPETAARHGGHGTPAVTVVDEVTAAGFDLERGPEPWRGRMYAVLFERAP
jgi:ubiquinone/menaquinone biosynthesis C-methylase UbiE